MRKERSSSQQYGIFDLMTHNSTIRNQSEDGGCVQNNLNSKYSKKLIKIIF
jgi:hypothetical protein